MSDNEKAPMVMLDPADADIVTVCQSNIRRSLTYMHETLKRYLPEGATDLSIRCEVYDFANGVAATGSMQVRDGYGSMATVGYARVPEVSTHSYLSAFDEAVADFCRQKAEASEVTADED